MSPSGHPTVIAQLVEDYEAGVETTELTERYRLGKGTVLKLLRVHGVAMRRQGLSPAEIDEAIQLYAAGWSLAKIGERFGRAHTVFEKCCWTGACGCGQGGAGAKRTRKAAVLLKMIVSCSKLAG
jgi:hypothetical protein